MPNDNSPEYRQYDTGASLIERLIIVLSDFAANARPSAGQSSYDAAVEQQRSRALIHLQSTTFASSPMAQMLGLNPNSSLLRYGGAMIGDANGPAAQLMKQMTGSNPMLAGQLEFSNRTGSTYSAMYGGIGNISAKDVAQDQIQMMQFMHYQHPLNQTEAKKDLKLQFDTFTANNPGVKTLFGLTGTAGLQDAKLNQDIFRQMQSYSGTGFNASKVESLLNVKPGDLDKMGINANTIGQKAEEWINDISTFQANDKYFNSSASTKLSKMGGEDYSKTYGVSQEYAESAIDMLGGSGRLKIKDISTDEGKRQLFHLVSAARELSPDLNGADAMKVLSQQMGTQGGDMAQMTKFANDIKSLSTLTGQKISTILNINKVIRESLNANPAFQGMDLGLTASDIVNQSAKQATMLQSANMSAKDLTLSGGPSGMQNGITTGQTNLLQDNNTQGLAGMRYGVYLKYKDQGASVLKAKLDLFDQTAGTSGTKDIFNNLHKAGLGDVSELSFNYSNANMQQAGILTQSAEVMAVANNQDVSRLKRDLSQLDVNDPLRQHAGRMNPMEYKAQVTAAYRAEAAKLAASGSPRGFNKYTNLLSSIDAGFNMDASGNTVNSFLASANGMSLAPIDKKLQAITADRENFMKTTGGALQQTALQNIINDIDTNKPLSAALDEFKNQSYKNNGTVAPSQLTGNLVQGLSDFDKITGRDKNTSDIADLVNTVSGGKFAKGKDGGGTAIDSVVTLIQNAKTFTPTGGSISDTVKSLQQTNPAAYKAYQDALGGDLNNDALNDIADAKDPTTILAKVVAQNQLKKTQEEKDSPFKQQFRNQSFNILNDPANHDIVAKIRAQQNFVGPTLTPRPNLLTNGGLDANKVAKAAQQGILGDLGDNSEDFVNSLTSAQNDIDKLNADEDNVSQYTKKDDKQDDVTKELNISLKQIVGSLAALVT